MIFFAKSKSRSKSTKVSQLKLNPCPFQFETFILLAKNVKQEFVENDFRNPD